MSINQRGVLICIDQWENSIYLGCMNIFGLMLSCHPDQVVLIQLSSSISNHLKNNQNYWEFCVWNVVIMFPRGKQIAASASPSHQYLLLIQLCISAQNKQKRVNKERHSSDYSLRLLLQSNIKKEGINIAALSLSTRLQWTITSSIMLDLVFHKTGINMRRLLWER